MIVELGKASTLTQSYMLGQAYDGGVVSPFIRLIPY
jgi:hypothetical protein